MKKIRYKAVKYSNGQESLAPDYIEIKYKTSGQVVREEEVTYLDDIDESEIQKVLDNPKEKAVCMKCGKAVNQYGKMKVVNNDKAVKHKGEEKKQHKGANDERRKNE